MRQIRTALTTEKSTSLRKKKSAESKPTSMPDQSEKSPDASTAIELYGTVEKSPATSNDENLPNTGNPSKLSPTSLTDFSKEVQTQSQRLRQSIENQKQKDAKIPKEELMNRIMASLGDSVLGVGESITPEQMNEIGLQLIRSYASIDLAAERLKMSPTRLRWLIINVPELHVYHEIAHEGIKSLTDRRIIEGLEAGDPEILKMVFNKMYAGRSKGGYNIAEIGTIGYKDPLAKELAAETEQDRNKAKTVVEFNFVTKDAKEKFEPISYVDAEYEEIKEGESSN